MLLLQSFWAVLVCLCTAESSRQLLKELHHKDIIGLQMCPTYTQGTQRHFLVPLLISLCLIFDGLWKVLRKMPNSCIFGWLNTFQNLNRGQFWSNAFLSYHYQLQWLVLWCLLSTKKSTFADGTKLNHPNTILPFCFQSLLQPLPFLTTCFVRNGCFPPEYHVTLSNWWPIRHYQDRIFLNHSFRWQLNEQYFAGKG